jgi:hypothetical protein
MTHPLWQRAADSFQRLGAVGSAIQCPCVSTPSSQKVMVKHQQTSTREQRTLTISTSVMVAPDDCRTPTEALPPLLPQYPGSLARSKPRRRPMTPQVDDSEDQRPGGRRHSQAQGAEAAAEEERGGHSIEGRRSEGVPSE